MLDFDSKQDTHTDVTCAPRAAPAEYTLPRPVRRGIEYILANFSEEVRLEDIAGAASLSTFHFARLFKQATGMAPHRYVMQVRVGKVKELLGEGELCLAAIADEAGFADQSHMSRVFKRLMGMTPKSFRRDRRLLAAPPRQSFELVRSRVQRLGRGGLDARRP